ncbi:relaxase/mobilization nuclease domain-containing protein [Azospirillum sp. sgz302134]
MSHGRGFAGCIAYVTEKDDAQVLEMRGVMSERTAAAEMRAVAAQSERVQKPVYHRWFRVADGERLTDEQWLATVDRAEQALGLEGHQRIVVRHSDRDGDHVHVVWNRVDPESYKAVRVSHDYAKCEQVCRQAEKEYGLQIVPGHHSWKEAGADHPPAPAQATHAERQHEDRTGREPFARIVAESGAQAFQHATSWADLTDRLQRAGLRLEPYRQGLTLTDGQERAGLSKVTGNEWTRAKLEKRFGQTFAAFQAGQSQDRPARDDRYERLVGSDPVPLRQRPSQSQSRQDAQQLRQQYQEYRTQFYRQANREHRSQQGAAAWRKEQAKRAEEAAERRAEAQRRKAIARAVFGRGMARNLTYAIIDRRFEKRSREERAVAAQRWQATKAELQAAPRPEVKAPEFRTWLADRARAGDETARRHVAHLERQPTVQTVSTAEQRPTAAQAKPTSEQDRPEVADRETMAEWERLIAARRADLQKRATALLDEATAIRREADERLAAYERHQPAELRGLAALVPGAQARYEQARRDWWTDIEAARKERNAHLGREQELRAFLGHDSSYGQVKENIHLRAAREVAEEHPELAKRMQAVRERQEAVRRKEIEQRRQQALNRFGQQRERDNSHGRGGRGGIG